MRRIITITDPVNILRARSGGSRTRVASGSSFLTRSLVRHNGGPASLLLRFPHDQSFPSLQRAFVPPWKQHGNEAPEIELLSRAAPPRCANSRQDHGRRKGTSPWAEPLRQSAALVLIPVPANSSYTALTGAAALSRLRRFTHLLPGKSKSLFVHAISPAGVWCLVYVVALHKRFTSM